MQTDGAGEAQTLPDAIRQFLERARFATIATVAADGEPHQAVIWYGLDGDAILINSRAGRRWPTNLERDPRISFAVYDDAEPEHWVGVKGRATRIREGEPAVADIMALARRYESDPEEFRGQSRVTFRVEIERVFEYGA
jgi:PPOX class probable F420-dependent enzyme